LLFARWGCNVLLSHKTVMIISTKNYFTLRGGMDSLSSICFVSSPSLPAMTDMYFRASLLPIMITVSPNLCVQHLQTIFTPQSDICKVAHKLPRRGTILKMRKKVCQQCSAAFLNKQLPLQTFQWQCFDSLNLQTITASVKHLNTYLFRRTCIRNTFLRTKKRTNSADFLAELLEKQQKNVVFFWGGTVWKWDKTQMRTTMALSLLVEHQHSIINLRQQTDIHHPIHAHTHLLHVTDL